MDPQREMQEHFKKLERIKQGKSPVSPIKRRKKQSPQEAMKSIVDWLNGNPRWRLFRAYRASQSGYKCVLCESFQPDHEADCPYAIAERLKSDE